MGTHADKISFESKRQHRPSKNLGWGFYTLKELREALSNEVNHLETLDASKPAITPGKNNLIYLEHTEASMWLYLILLTVNFVWRKIIAYTIVLSILIAKTEVSKLANFDFVSIVSDLIIHCLPQCIRQVQCKSCRRNNHTLLCNKEVEVAQARG